jgi:hypothetical protein
MSVYEINKLCYRTLREPDFREALKREPEGTMRSLPLTEEERQLLLAGEVGKLHDLGAHAYLLSHLSRFELFGLTVETYSERIRTAKPPFGTCSSIAPSARHELDAGHVEEI